MPRASVRAVRLAVALTLACPGRGGAAISPKPTPTSPAASAMPADPNARTAEPAALIAQPPKKPTQASSVPLAIAQLALVPEATTHLGRTVAAVTLQVPPGENAQALAELVDVQPGFVLEAAQVQSTIERLYALGRFAQVEARVVPQGEAVELRLHISPIVRLEEVQLRGVKRADDDELRQALRLQAGDEVDGQTEARARRRAMAFLARAGYPRARVSVRRVPGVTPSTAALHLAVVEGEPDRIASVRVGGATRLAPGYLMPLLPVRPGQVLDQAALERGRETLEAAYREHGFWRAEVRLSALTYLPSTPGAPRAARVRYVVHAHERLTFAFRGNRLLCAGELRELWPSRVAGAPQTLLAQYASRVQAQYARESYPHARVRAALRPAAPLRLRSKAQQACEVTVDIEEGAPVTVTGIHLEGAHSFPNDVLRRQVRAVLARELTHPSFFSPLGATGVLWGGASSHGVGWAPHRVPPERRWVPELYARAADDIAAAYRAAGFLEVEVTVPAYLPEAATLVTPTQAGPKGSARTAIGPASASASAWRDDVDASAPFVRPISLPPPPPERVTARLLVREGTQHFVERVTLRHNEQLSARELLAVATAATGHYQLAAPLRPGAPLSAQGVEDARIALLRHYREQGFFYAQVAAEVQTHPSGAEVSFDVEEGPRVRVAHLLVRGNRHTREGVVRSRMTLSPGGLYRLDRAIADQQEMMALGTFRRARVKLIDEEHPSAKKDVVAEVEERPRQPVEVVPGLSTAAGPRLRLSYAHINVFGTASTFVASLKVNRQMFFRLYGPYAETMRERYAAYRGAQQLTRALEREVRVGLRSPRIKALPFDPLLRLDVVDQRLNAVRYGLDAATATFGIDTDPTPSLRLSLEVQGGITDLECPLGDNCDQNPDVRRLRGGRPIQQGRRHTYKFGPIIRYDHRDDPIAPSRGFVLQGRLSQAFGAARPEHVSFPFAFTKYEGSATGYVPTFGAVWATSLRAGVIQLERSAAPVDERFFLGGRDSLRGFVESTLVAQDACVVDDPGAPLPAHCVEGIAADPSPPLSLGGNSFLLWKNELRLPLGAGMSFDVFVDVGNLWVDLFRAERLQLRVGTGVGLRYATPVGAMTLDFGVNPARRSINQEAGWQFHFSIGSF